MKRDCTCPRARHQHGTVTAYNIDACRCLDCRQAVLVRQRDYRKRAKLANSAGTALSVPSIGTARRLQALAALGWTATDLAARLGMTAEGVGQMQRPNTRDRVFLSTAQRIDALYDELSMRRPTPWRWFHARCAAEAARKGYLPPLSYDDETIDTPEDFLHIRHDTEDMQFTDDITPNHRDFVDEVAVERAMHGERIKLTKAEMSDAVAKLTDMGYATDMIAARLGVSDRLVQRYRAKGRAA